MNKLSGVVRVSGLSNLVLVFMLGAVAAFTTPACFIADARVLPETGGNYRSPFIEVAENLSPSIVQVTTVRVETVREAPFEERFGDQLPEELRRFFERRQPAPQRDRRREGLGSGVVISSDGYIVTNYHIIHEVDDIQVKLLDEDKLYDAEVIGIDEVTDIAVIKIEPGRELVPAELGDSDNLRVGEWAIAIGNPFGLEKSVTVGVISAVGRAGFPGLPRYQDFIQTDASINMGNSGGALANIDGEVIGINTFIMSPYIAQGLGFAIPINIVKNVQEQLVAHGHIRRGYLGVVPQDITPAIAGMLELPPGTDGVVIAHVQPDTAASRSGLRVKDVVVEFDGRAVTEEERFRRMIADTPAGKKVEIRIIRAGEEKTLEAVLDELPVRARPQPPEEERVHLGFEVSELTPQLAERLGIEEAEGVVVIEVRGGTLAERMLRPGDIIKQVNRTAVSTVSDYNAALAEIQPGEDVVLLVQRGEHTLFVELRAE